MKISQPLGDKMPTLLHSHYCVLLFSDSVSGLCSGVAACYFLQSAYEAGEVSASLMHCIMLALITLTPSQDGMIRQKISSYDVMRSHQSLDNAHIGFFVRNQLLGCEKLHELFCDLRVNCKQTLFITNSISVWIEES